MYVIIIRIVVSMLVTLCLCSCVDVVECCSKVGDVDSIVELLLVLLVI